MEKETQVAALLEWYIHRSQHILSSANWSVAYKEWVEAVDPVLELFFGPSCPERLMFLGASVHKRAHFFSSAIKPALEKQVEFLRAWAAAMPNKYEERLRSEVSTNLLFMVVGQVLRRFSVTAGHLSARPRAAKKDRGFPIDDEYDLQDLLFALLKPLVEDLELENPLPKQAGDSGRADLSSKTLGVIIELKVVREASDVKRITADCRDRILKYGAWKDLKHLVFYLYDPKRLIPDRDNVQKDLTSAKVSLGGAEYSCVCLVGQ
jgi:hypothetical protein